MMSVDLFAAIIKNFIFIIRTIMIELSVSEL